MTERFWRRYWLSDHDQRACPLRLLSTHEACAGGRLPTRVLMPLNLTRRNEYGYPQVLASACRRPSNGGPPVPRTDPPIFFVSYARADVEHPPFLESLEVFVKDLGARVAGKLAIPIDGVSFTDANIHTGELWSDHIRDALMQCRVGLALYSPHYFARRWCGKEFQVLLTRSRPTIGGTGIVPVRWEKDIPDPPPCAARLQYNEDAFPPEYGTRGMRQLVALRSVALQAYEDSIDVLACRIVAEAVAQRLTPLQHLDFETTPSAWEASSEADPYSHMQGRISKTCFVFLSKHGWDWVPYEADAAKIGALAQRITGELGLRYEEIPCDAALPQKLKEANDSDVPTVLFGDPTSCLAEPFMQSLRHYDTQYLLNCATLVPWEPGTKDNIETDPRWLRLKREVCPQKTESPPPYHEWRSIFSQDELNLKTRTLIEQIRSRVMKQLVSNQDRGGGARRVEDSVVAKSAAALGILTQSLSRLAGPSR